jgi:peptidoglycan/LPS O-acetylase OafA/YrhL
MNHGRIGNLDGVRGLAALSVLIGHCHTHATGVPLLSKQIYELPEMPLDDVIARLIRCLFPTNGAVILFFVLSGYVLTRSLWRSTRAPAEELAVYGARRALRLLPMAIVAAPPYFLLLAGTVPALIGAMLLYDYSLNGVLWTLQVEVIGSAAVFLMYLLCLWDKRLVWIALAGSLAASALSSSFLVIFLPAFAVGAAVFHHENWPLWSSGRLLALGTILLLLAGLLLGEFTMLGRGAWLVSSAIVVGCCRVRYSRVLSSRASQFLGAVSYPLYLLHGACLIVTGRLVDPIVTVPLLRFAACAILTCAIALPLSWLAHRAIEIPGIACGSLITRRPTGPELTTR